MKQKFRVEARVDKNTPAECLPWINKIVEQKDVTTHADGCRCTFVPVETSE